LSQESEASSIDLDLENLSISLVQTKAHARTDANDAFEVTTLLDSLLISDEKLDIVMENILSETIYTVGEEEEEITATSECKTLI
jgi:hypothetical protein